MFAHTKPPLCNGDCPRSASALTHRFAVVTGTTKWWKGCSRFATSERDVRTAFCHPEAAQQSAVERISSGARGPRGGMFASNLCGGKVTFAQEKSGVYTPRRSLLARVEIHSLKNAVAFF